ncbi:MAG: sigma-70 family RNA polymerase sigma factor, partial [Gemmataceae bacterium]|nr:sigma-70 family RNA polymerase sigma factor [Gemmataceae bacterium]
VRRHGPMVLRLCRAVLGNWHAAEDAFQATFLILARKAGTIQKHQSLSSWLYKVAHRVAVRAREEAIRRREHEARSPQPRPADPLDEISWREVQAIFYDELAKLSERYRAPLILCCLEGKTRDEAAQQLGCPAGTLKSRLERGRRLLRTRLARRGLTLSAGLLATLLAPEGASAVLPGALCYATIRAGLVFGAGAFTTGVIPIRIRTLAEGVIQAMFVSKMKVAAATLLVLGTLVATGAGFGLQRIGPATPTNAQPQAGQQATPRSAEPIPPAAVQVRADWHGEPLRGTVYAADGFPAAGAAVWAAKFISGPLQRHETVADANGRYALQLDPGTWWVWARRGTQGGQGAVWPETVEVTAGRAPLPVTIRLEERGTLRGRLLEAETGKPIPGGRLFLDEGLMLTTAADGRFEVGGLQRSHHEAFAVAPGRVRLRVLFDTTARADTELDVPLPRSGKMVGRVTDWDGKPVPGAFVGRGTSGNIFSGSALFVNCDSEGRFEYDGADPPDWLARGQLIAEAPGYVMLYHPGRTRPTDSRPRELRFRLRPGTPGTPAGVPPSEAEQERVVSGVVRGPDGKPVADVLVRWGNRPFGAALQSRTDAGGRFRIAVPDQDGMLAVLPRDFAPEFPRIAAGGDQTVAVTVQPGHTARGRVLDETSRPIPGVRVIAVAPSQGWMDPALTEAATRTDAEGKFALKGIPKGARFAFSKPGLSKILNRELALDGADNAVTMHYNGAVRGRVLDQDGKPVRNFRVFVELPRVLQRRPGDKFDGLPDAYIFVGVRFTSADGTFVLTGVGPGSVYRITAQVDGHGEAVAERVLAVPANRLGEAEQVTLRVRP